MKRAKTFAELLRRWDSAPKLRRALAAQGYEASEVLIRRWWNEEMLPPAAWLSFVAAAQEAGHSDIDLELLASIAQTERPTRLRILQARRPVEEGAAA